MELLDGLLVFQFLYGRECTADIVVNRADVTSYSLEGRTDAEMTEIFLARTAQVITALTA